MMDAMAAEFEAYRPRLFGVAYRMLGSRADAEDVLQDAWLRWHNSPGADIQSPVAWLITTTTRLCLDRLRLAKQAREHYIGPWLPEPIVTDSLPSPEMQLELADEVSVAFLAVLERLGPEERAAFLLHEVFDYDYPEIARILAKAEPACRQLVHRAKVRVREARPRFAVAQASRERLLEKFISAASSGDREAVMALLSEDAQYVSDGGGKVVAALKVLHGPERIARLYYCIARTYAGMTYHLIRINGELGSVNIFGGKLHSILSFETDGDRIVGIYVMRNPDKLAGISLEKFGI
jgi:RNA polymerase sigma-70 factor (ECF subfamily)